MSEETPDTSPVIRPAPNGPLIVRNVPRLSNSKGKPIETKTAYILCRCGASSKKPFCDGTHKKIGFSSENTADRGKDRKETYTGREVSIHDNRFLCAHAGVCTDNLASVFRTGREPWIDPDGDTPGAIAEVVRRCPSGALSFTFQAQLPEEEPREPGISVSKNGPYCVEGAVELEEAEWSQDADRRRFALCRCGASKNKPFCDGSHWNAGFTDDAN